MQEGGNKEAREGEWKKGREKGKRENNANVPYRKIWELFLW